jgi:Protein of unknown function (DUF1552)
MKRTSNIKPNGRGSSRRMFLRGLGGAALALPFLESLAPRTARAQATGPKRFIVVKSFSTQLVKEWYPRFEGNGYALKDARYDGSKADGTTLLTERIASGLPYSQAALTDFQTSSGISGIIGEKLNPYLSKMNLIRGLDFLPEVNHNYGGLLGNFSSCTNATPCTADELGAVPTIDQVLAYSSKFYPDVPVARYLHLSQGVSDSMSFTDRGMGGAVEQLKARTNPLDAFNDLFGGATAPVAPGDGATAGANERDALLVDRVMDQYRSLKQSSRLSSADRQKVDQYVNLMAELQAKLSVKPMLSCTAPAEPESLGNNENTDASDIVRKWDIMLDLVQAGLMCDRTRVVTLAVHKALGPGPDPEDSSLTGHYHSENAAGGTWHGLAHDWGNENSRRMLAGINRWVANEFFAKLLERLDVAEGESTLLDNSFVYWGNELGFNHLAYSVPCLTAGSAGGAITTGRYLDYIDWEGQAYFSQEDGNVIQGIPHNQFLVSVLQAMGLSPADYERGGQPGYGSTDTQTKDPNLWATDYDLSSVGDPLPGFLT